MNAEVQDAIKPKMPFGIYLRNFAFL